MPSVLNPITDMYQTQLEASRRFADVVFSGTEKIDHIVIEATHRAFTEQLNFAHAVAGARDTRGVANLQAAFFSHRPDNAVSYQKEIVRVLAEIQNEFGRSMQDYLERFGSTVANNATAPLKAAHDQTNDAVFNPITGMFSVWESAFKEVASLANKNMAAARSSYESAADAASRTTQSATDAATDAARRASDATSEAAEEVTSVTVNGGRTAAQASDAPAMGGEEVAEEKRPQPSTSRRK